MHAINEENLNNIDINLNIDKKEINEGYLRAVGAQIELLLKTMFGGTFIPARIRGTTPQISSFARALGNERRYLEAFEKFGLGDSKTMLNRHKLEAAITNFERETSLTWPFK